MKKGYTLIEILGVIGILGILLLIAMTSYNGIVRKTRNDAYQRQIDTIIQFGKDWALNNFSNLSKDNSNIVLLEELLEQGYITDEVINPKTGKPMQGCVIITWDFSYQQYTYEYTENNCSN